MSPSTPVPEQKSTLTQSLTGIFVALYRLAPAVVIVGIIVLTGMAWACLRHESMMVTAVLGVVGISSLFVYFGSGSYNQGAIALVGGLLTAFSVQWTQSSFVAFIGLWGGFSFLVFLAESVKLSATSEQLYRRAAILLSPDSYEKMERTLQEISDGNKTGYLGPTARAEAMLYFSFRRVPIELMASLLDLVGKISAVTGLSAIQTTHFITDFYKAVASGGPHHLMGIWELLRNVPVPPEDVVASFHNSKTIVVSKRLSVDAYLKRFKAGLDCGVPPDRMEAYILERID